MRAPLLVSLAAILPFGLVAWGVNAAADRAGGILGAELAALGANIQDLEARSEPLFPEDLALLPVEALPANASVAAEPADRAGSKRKRPRSAERAAAPARGLGISAATVLRLANSGARPRGVPVAAQGERPAGILLAGVSRLGVGLADGDVLVEVAGRPAHEVGQVIEAVIAARAARAREVSGRFWRNGELWSLTVEQPYGGVESGQPQNLPAERPSKAKD